MKEGLDSLKTILLIEDEDEDYEAFVDQLRGLYRVVRRTTLAGGVEYLETEESPHMIFCDLFLPDASGTEAPDKLNALCPGRVSVLTNSKDPMQIDRIQRKGYELVSKEETIVKSQFRAKIQDIDYRQFVQLQVSVEHLQTRIKDSEGMSAKHAAIEVWREAVSEQLAQVRSLVEKQLLARLEVLEKKNEALEQKLDPEKWTIKQVIGWTKTNPLALAAIGSFGATIAVLAEHGIKFVKQLFAQ